MKTLENKRIIVLGGSSGLGLATAQAAAADGAEVIIVSSNQQRIDQALATLPENSKGFALSLDREENIKSFFSSIGNFDHLVYTAGENISMSMVDDTDIEKGKDFFTIRFWGAFAAIKYGKQYINEGGSINLMSGNFGQRPAAGYSLGATICGAMDAFTKAMAVELAPIRVNNIAAGIIDTNLWGNLSQEDKESFFSHLEKTLLLKRVGQPVDVADTFVFLMKQEYITGQSLIIDGGAVLV